MQCVALREFLVEDLKKGSSNVSSHVPAEREGGGGGLYQMMSLWWFLLPEVGECAVGTENESLWLYPLSSRALISDKEAPLY